MSDGAETKVTYGGFALGGLELALPMSALREVVRCKNVTALPCPAKCVIGGVDLRGMMIPVVDLRIVFGHPAPAAEGRHVVIIAHNGALMGLLADDLRGLFEAAPGSFRRTIVGDAIAAVFLASVQRADNGKIVSILSSDALAQLSQVPMVEDLEAARHERDEIAEFGIEPATTVPMVLLACNGIPFAVESGIVYATLSKPCIEITALSNLSVIVYDGVKIPVIDLLELCGLGRIDRSNDTAAIVVAMKTGYVALLISNVLDVVQTRVHDVTPLPAFALPRPGLFAGSLPLSALPTALVTRFEGSVNQFLVIDAARLQADNSLLSAGGMNSSANGKKRNPLALVDLGSSNRRPMITFMLETEHATPLEHVREILTYQPGTELFRTAGPMLGLMVHRSRSVPVMCLGQMFGEARSTPTASSRILVVESGDELVGFAVRQLNSIEQADWEPSIRGSERAGAARGESQKLACFESRTIDQMLPIVDLRALVASLREAVPLTADN
jgi:purine-binding chemotaxis protein CheW